MPDEALLWDLTDSPYCAKARMCLQLKGVPFRRMTLTLRGLRTLRGLNPAAKVPVLVHGTQTVADSTAIAHYLETLVPEPALRLHDPAARAYGDLLEDWADESLGFVVGGLKWLNPENRERAIARTMSELAPGPLQGVMGRLVASRIARRYHGQGFRGADGVTSLQDRLRAGLASLDGLLEGRAFLVGRAPTLADVAVFAQVSWLRNYAEARLLGDAPAVQRWCERLDGVPAIAAALSA
ncbi:MAG: glutathione S-transferase family protein [bacterium]|nr:glutathione S-transferase family protein [bacterium]